MQSNIIIEYKRDSGYLEARKELERIFEGRDEGVIIDVLMPGWIGVKTILMQKRLSKTLKTGFRWILGMCSLQSAGFLSTIGALLRPCPVLSKRNMERFSQTRIGAILILRPTARKLTKRTSSRKSARSSVPNLTTLLSTRSFGSMCFQKASQLRGSSAILFSRAHKTINMCFIFSFL